jgi:hypothetical protein
MTRYIFTLILVFTSAALAFSPPNTFAQEDACFRSTYLAGAENSGNAFKISHTLQVNCNQQGAQAQTHHMNGRAVHTALLSPGDVIIGLSVPSLQLTRGRYMIQAQQGTEVETKKI